MKFAHDRINFIGDVVKENTMDINPAGDWVLSPEEVKKYSAAAKACEELFDQEINLAEPITRDQVFNLFLARAWLEDGSDGIKTLIHHIDKEIQSRTRH